MIHRWKEIKLHIRITNLMRLGFCLWYVTKRFQLTHYFYYASIQIKRKRENKNKNRRMNKSKLKKLTLFFDIWWWWWSVTHYDDDVGLEHKQRQCSEVSLSLLLPPNMTSNHFTLYLFFIYSPCFPQNTPTNISY